MIENTNWLALGGFVLLAIERVIYYSSRYKKRCNPGTVEGVTKLLDQHEKRDEKRCDEMKETIEKVREELQEHGERLARLESPGQ